MFNQGDIVAVKFPFTDLINSKLRPALVISNNQLQNSNDVIIMMISSQVKEDGFSIELDKKYLHEPLPKKSFLRYHRIATAEVSIIDKKINSVDPVLTKLAIEKLNELLSDNIEYQNTTVQH